MVIKSKCKSSLAFTPKNTLELNTEFDACKQLGGIEKCVNRTKQLKTITHFFGRDK